MWDVTVQYLTCSQVWICQIASICCRLDPVWLLPPLPTQPMWDVTVQYLTCSQVWICQIASICCRLDPVWLLPPLPTYHLLPLANRF
uniref:Uncharacterized protein n=1 Tax=Kalanchoe fedtschenkoi TaxID=63787 RepID=A0A7N0TP50_KALFE